MSSYKFTISPKKKWCSNLNYTITRRKTEKCLETFPIVSGFSQEKWHASQSNEAESHHPVVSLVTLYNSLIGLE